MKILSLRRQYDGGNTLARFDAEVAPGIRAYGLRLVQSQKGLRVFGPSIAGGSAVTMDVTIADHLADLAMREVAQHDNSK